MLGRYIKSQIWVLICGGLVGPIFLAVYFATGQSVLMRWMFWVGLLITAADVLIALALANFGAKSEAKTQALEQSGVLALAQVVGIQETGTRINEQPLVKLDLQISGPGITPFATQDRVIASITRLPMITNRKLVALVDPTTNEYQIDWERSALVGGRDAGELHHRRGQQDLRPERAGGSVDGDPADPQGQWDRPEQHDRSALQPGGPSAGAGGRPARRGRTTSTGGSSTVAPPLVQRRTWRRPSRPPHSGCKNWKPCAPPARSPTMSTTPSASRSCPIFNQIRESAMPLMSCRIGFLRLQVNASAVHDGNGAA